MRLFKNKPQEKQVDCDDKNHCWTPWSEPYEVTLRVYGDLFPPSGADDVRRFQKRHCVSCNLSQEKEVKRDRCI